MRPYLDLLSRVLTHGVRRPDRTGVGTLGVFGCRMRFDLSEGFPLMTTKKLHVKSIVHELLWFLAGETNVARLRRNGVSIWDEWADANGDLGPVYGRQWRSWEAPDGRRIDQIRNLADGLTRDPYARRHVVVAWNPADLSDMALPPCHCLFQFHVEPVDDGPNLLSCQVYQRSADVFLGLPFNIASYALLTLIMAQASGYAPGSLVHVLGDAHLYVNHVEQATTQIARTPGPLPRMHLDPARTDPFSFVYDDFTLTGYDPAPAIPAPVAV